MTDHKKIREISNVIFAIKLSRVVKRGNVFHFFHYFLLLQFFIIDARIILLDFLGPQEDNPT